MGKQTVITCDSCGAEVWGKKYFTMDIRKIMQGKQTLKPELYLCPICFGEMKRALLLVVTGKSTKEVE